jgi:hypothetical protein
MKINRGRTQFLVWLFLLASAAWSHGQLLFTTNNGAITITGYTGSDSQVVIPSTTNGWPVTSIGNGAFLNNSNITSVTIPAGVTDIGQLAFAYCTNLASAPFPNSLSTIDYSAFYLCRHLTNIVIPDNVTTLGSSAFSLCYNLTNIVIGSSVANVPDNAFESCTSLSSITIPDAVTNIGTDAFHACTSATNLSLGSNIVTIGANAFDLCSRLGSISLPSSVRTIGAQAFELGFNLTNLNIGPAVTNIGGNFVDGCSKLPAINVDSSNLNYKSVNGVLFNADQSILARFPEGKAGAYVIPDTVTNTGYEAFRSCSNLVKITTGNGLVGMGLFAFYLCGNVTNLTISSGLTNAGIIDFSDLFGLRTINVDGNNATYTSVDGVLFDRGRTTVVVYPAGRTNNSYTIPDGVTLVQSNAFSSCVNLTTLTVPATVASIGPNAFLNARNLTGIYFEGNAPIGGGLGLVNIYFSYGLLKIYYLPGTTGWSSSFDSLPGVPTALWKLPYPLILNNGPGFGIQTNQFGFTISWATNASIVVEASTNPIAPIWQPVATNPLTSGAFYFSDANWTNYPERFYRVRSQ